MPMPMSMPSVSEQQKSRRPEMRGPTTDVSDMMSRLKTKTINIQPGNGNGSGGAGPDQGNATLQNILSGMTGSGGNNNNGGDDISFEPTVINVSSLGDIPQDSAPHKSKRRPRSEKNTVSMDL
jgi:hypothetical protein